MSEVNAAAPSRALMVMSDPFVSETVAVPFFWVVMNRIMNRSLGATAMPALPVADRVAPALRCGREVAPFPSPTMRLTHARTGELGTAYATLAAANRKMIPAAHRTHLVVPPLHLGTPRLREAGRLLTVPLLLVMLATADAGSLVLLAVSVHASSRARSAISSAATSGIG